MVRHAVNKTPVGVLVTLAVVLGIAISAPRIARADEGGVSFWLPGLYGSLAAAPLMPGWSFATVYYHTSVSQTGSIAAAREIRVNNLSATLKVNLDLNLKSNADLVFLNPSYVFAAPLFGGQLAIGVAAVTGRVNTSLDGTLTAMLGPLATTRTGRIDSSLTGFGDLYPTVSLRWNNGVHNFMVYGTAIFRWAPTIRRAWPISVSAMAPSTAVWPTPISIRRVGLKRLPPQGLLLISKIPTPTTQMEWTGTWTGACRNSCPSNSSSARSAIFTIRSRPTVVKPHSLAQTNRASSVLARKLAIFFQLASRLRGI